MHSITHAVAVDATRAELTSASGSTFYVVARAAVLHTGDVQAGRLHPADPFLGKGNTTYLGEEAATEAHLQRHLS